MVQFCCSRLGFKDIYTLEKDSFGDLAHFNTQCKKWAKC